MAKVRRVENIGLTPIENALQELRYVRAKCDILFTLAGQTEQQRDSLSDLEHTTLSAFFSDMLDSCGRIEESLDKIERTSKAAA